MCVHVCVSMLACLNINVREMFCFAPSTFQLMLTKQRDKTEVIYRRLLKEDKGTGQWEGTSYIDFLCQVHRDIKEILS